MESEYNAPLPTGHPSIANIYYIRDTPNFQLSSLQIADTQLICLTKFGKVSIKSGRGEYCLLQS